MNRTSKLPVLETPKIKRTADAKHQGVGVVPCPKWSISDRWAWPHSLPVSGIARAVAGVIAFHADEHTGRSWPGMGTIAKKTGFCRTAVVKAIKELERGGHVTVRRFKVGKKNALNRYQLPPMGGGQEALPSAPDALPPSASDAPKQVRVRTYPPRGTEMPALPKHLEAIEGGHGVKCRRCDHIWPRGAGLSHMCVGRSERTEQPKRPRQTRKGRSTDTRSERINRERLARIRDERAGMGGVT